MSCIFCKIVSKEVASETVYEDDKFLAFEDMTPVAPVHILVIPKKHIETINHIESQDKKVIGALIIAAKEIAKIKGVSESGYRLIFNIGKDAGQTVDHLHLHLIGGKKLAWA